jgi:predicted nuclease of restriction endonuclease-like RecB superfamily
LEPQTASRLSSLGPGAELVLDYLTPEDERWLTVLLAECGRHAGLKVVELRERLADPLGVPTPKHKLRAAAQVLLRLLPESPSREPAPREVRARLFRAAAAQPEGRQQVLSRVAEELRVDAPTLEQALFSDLAGERRVGALPGDLTPSRLALLVNRALVYGHLKRADLVKVTTSEPGHALVRQARRLGLIGVARAPSEGRVVLELSGPFALFRRTELYGRALASLLSYAARSPSFELCATCEPRGRGRCTLRITGASPIFAENAPTAFDSRARTRLLRDLAQLGPELRLVAEPAPVSVGDELLFPDFELLDPRNPTPYRFELVGFWTPPHLSRRLAQLRAAGEERYVLCVDETRGCGDAEPPEAPGVLRYRTRLRATELLAHLRA